MNNRSCRVALFLAVAVVLPACGGTNPFFLGQILPSSGALFTDFGTAGVVTVDQSPGADIVYALATDATSLYVGLVDETPGLGDPQWRIEKRNLADGSLDLLFGSQGAVIVNAGTLTDTPAQMSVDDEFLFILGRSSGPGGTDEKWRLEKRDKADGSLILTFGTNGVVTSDPSASRDSARAFARDSEALYIVGSDRSPGEMQWRIEKRRLVDGVLVDTFGTAGVVTTNPTAGDDEAYDVVLDSEALYIVGYSVNADASFEWRIEKRSLFNGALIPWFGTSGVLTVNPSTGIDNATMVALDATGLYVLGQSGEPGGADGEWRVEKRDPVTGAPISGFGTLGVLRINPGPGGDALGLGKLIVDQGSFYVIGNLITLVGTDYQWRVEKRDALTGAPVLGFGTSGVLTLNPTVGNDGLFAVAVSSDALFIGGYHQGPAPTDFVAQLEKRGK